MPPGDDGPDAAGFGADAARGDRSADHPDDPGCFGPPYHTAPEGKASRTARDPDVKEFGRSGWSDLGCRREGPGASASTRPVRGVLDGLTSSTGCRAVRSWPRADSVRPRRDANAVVVGAGPSELGGLGDAESV